jgi:hypothetical protein
VEIKYFKTFILKPYQFFFIKNKEFGRKRVLERG